MECGKSLFESVSWGCDFGTTLFEVKLYHCKINEHINMCVKKYVQMCELRHGWIEDENNSKMGQGQTQYLFALSNDTKTIAFGFQPCDQMQLKNDIWNNSDIIELSTNTLYDEDNPINDIVNNLKIMFNVDDSLKIIPIVSSKLSNYCCTHEITDAFSDIINYISVGWKNEDNCLKVYHSKPNYVFKGSSDNQKWYDEYLNHEPYAKKVTSYIYRIADQDILTTLS